METKGNEQTGGERDKSIEQKRSHVKTESSVAHQTPQNQKKHTVYMFQGLLIPFSEVSLTKTL